MNKIGFVIAKGSRILKKYSPEIALVVGVVGVGATAFLASKATLKLEKTIDNAKDRMDVLKDIHSEEGVPKQESLRVYAHGIADVGRLYLPTIITGTITVSAIIGGYSIMKKRNLVLLASYLTLQDKYSKYRETVKLVVSEEDRERIEKAHLANMENVEVDDIGINEMNKDVETDDYSRTYNSFTSTAWHSSPEMNVLFLTAQERLANDILRAKGVLFLNDVYEMLGFKKIPEGQLVGWIVDVFDNVPNVEFGIDWIRYDGPTWSKDDIMEQVSKGVLLSFNVQGVVHELM